MTAGRARAVDVVAAALLLILLGLFLQRFITAVGAIAAIVLALPLLIPAIVYLSNPTRGYQWLCVLIIPYLGIAVVELIADPERRLWATAFAVAGLVQFGVASLGTRISRKRPPRS